jgi:hypothetical protein
MSDGKRRIAIFAVAFAVRLGWFALHPVSMGPDAIQYHTIARNLLRHGAFSLATAPPFEQTLRRAPLYPLFLAAVGADPQRARIVQGALDACVAVILFALASRFAKASMAILAAMLYAFHPAAIGFSNAILSECLFAFLSAAALMLILLALERGAAWLAASGGVTLGLAALCRPVMIGFIPVVVVLIAVRRREVRRALMNAAVVAGAAILTIIPWIVRSSLAAHHFVLVQSTGPVNFAIATLNIGLDLNRQETIWTNPLWLATPCGHALGSARTAPEAADADAVCARKGLADLRRAPGAYLRGRMRQFPRLVLTSFDTVTGARKTIGEAVASGDYRLASTKLALYAVFSLTPLALGIVGAVRSRALANRLATALWVYTIAIYMPGYVEYRYFAPAVAMLLVNVAASYVSSKSGTPNSGLSPSDTMRP